jgi:hypothetical protein
VTWASVLSLDRSEPALARVPFTHTPPFRHNGMGHALCRGVDCFRIHRPRGWSVYGAQQAQPVASTGKSAGRRNRVNKPKLLPWVATGCRGRQMVRRGSTVRVRQRALQNRRTTGLLVSDRFADSRTWGRYGALMEPSGRKRGPGEPHCALPCAANGVSGRRNFLVPAVQRVAPDRHL